MLGELLGLGAAEGAVDIANCDRIDGWAYDSANPNAPVTVGLYDNGDLIATVPAATLRDDLKAAGKGNGLHSFSYVHAFGAGDPHMITAKVGASEIGRQPAFSCANPLVQPAAPPPNALLPVALPPVAAPAVASGTIFGLSPIMLAVIGGGLLLMMSKGR